MVCRYLALVVQAGLRFLPERLLYVVGDLTFMLEVYEARQVACRDRNVPLLACPVGEPHDLVGSSIQRVHRQHVAWRFDRAATHDADRLTTSSNCSSS